MNIMDMIWLLLLRINFCFGNNW